MQARRRDPIPRPLRLFGAFLDRLRAVRVLDPACGSGNFLYIALGALKDLELEAIQWGSLVLRIPQQFPGVGPEAVLGIEINPYAAELARVTIWIGEIQWMLNHGFAYRRNPVLSSLDSIATMDALLDLSDPTNPRDAEWPGAEFIVGNPPFLGGSLLRSEPRRSVHGGALVDLRATVSRRRRTCAATGTRRRVRRLLPGEFETSRPVGDAGYPGPGEPPRARTDQRDRRDLLWHAPTIRGSSTGPHVTYQLRRPGRRDPSRSGRSTAHPSQVINADLTRGLDFTTARRLRENRGIAFMGDKKGGPFEIDEATARRMLAAPNPDGRPNR